jgi:hypothetical protein
LYSSRCADDEWTNAGARKQWDDEKQDDIKEEWDADSPVEEPAVAPVSQKPKKALDLAIERREQREQEEKLRLAMAKLVMGETDVAAAAAAGDDALAEKLRRQKIVCFLFRVLEVWVELIDVCFFVAGGRR